MIHATPAGVEIDVRVIPRASKTTIAGERNGRVLVRLSAPPVDGAANDALIEFFSKLFACPKRAVRIVSGDTHRSKRVAIDGVTVETARAVVTAV